MLDVSAKSRFWKIIGHFPLSQHSLDSMLGSHLGEKVSLNFYTREHSLCIVWIMLFQSEQKSLSVHVLLHLL